MTYGKEKVASEIRESRSAGEAKRAGRKIITERNWDIAKLDIMRHIIRAKAQCVPEYGSELLRSNDIIVEAVPGDKFWSSGLSKEEVRWCSPENWPGMNMMGKLHIELRDEIKVDQ